MNIRTLAAIAIAALTLAATAAKAEGFLQEQSSAQTLTDVAATDADRLLIVNGNNGHVIYDDGRDDLFCVTRKVVVGYDDWGHPIRKRTMRCR
jgi:hypothetical protein